MNPFIIAFNLQRVLVSIIAFVLWALLCFAAGYAYKWHVDALARAEETVGQEMVSTVITQAVKVADDKGIKQLQSQLATYKAKSVTLQKQLKDQSDATPAPPDCRLDDGLRDKINADLAAIPR